ARFWKTRTVRRILLITVGSSCVVAASCVACLFKGRFIDYVIIKGQVVDADSLAPLPGAFIGARPFVNGEPIGFVSGSASQRSLPVLVTGPDGSFALTLTTGAREECATPLGPTLPPPEFPPPDQVEVTVGLVGCQDTFLIDVNADTVVDLTFPDMVLELIDPILVPPCGG
ncbi:MAG: hypothetical protein ACE5E6_08300, partial [Phycisphaerae bacterium]